MTLEERSNLVLAFAQALYTNGQSTDETLAAAEGLGETQTVGMRGLECLEGYRVPGLLGLTAATGTRAPDDRQTLEPDGPALVEVLVHRRKGP